jgi:acetyl esterase/lipase
VQNSSFEYDRLTSQIEVALMKIDDEVLLWPDNEPDVQVEDDQLDEKGWYHHVSIPKLVPFVPSPEKANGACLLICPGGSYRILDWVSHVERLAALFVPLGYSVVGLKYRTSSPNNDVPELALSDLKQALNLLGTFAEKWNIDVNKIIGLGYSAGSNLLLNYTCDSKKKEEQPSVCLNDPKISYLALMCLWPNQRSSTDYSIEPVVENVFLCTTEEDKVGPASFSHSIGEKMTEKGVNVTTHFFPKGGHQALNFKENGPEVDWTPPFFQWLKDKGLD